MELTLADAVALMLHLDRRCPNQMTQLDIDLAHARLTEKQEGDQL